MPGCKAIEETTFNDISAHTDFTQSSFNHNTHMCIITYQYALTMYTYISLHKAPNDMNSRKPLYLHSLWESPQRSEQSSSSYSHNVWTITQFAHFRIFSTTAPSPGPAPSAARHPPAELQHHLWRQRRHSVTSRVTRAAARAAGGARASSSDRAALRRVRVWLPTPDPVRPTPTGLTWPCPSYFGLSGSFSIQFDLIWSALDLT